jgi:sulfur carrier protein ThiS
MRASVRFYAQLVDLADAAELDVPVGEPRSVKDLIEAQGVPHPEIGLVVVDGQPVSLQHRISGGERVAVYPPLRSLAPPGGGGGRGRGAAGRRRGGAGGGGWG